MSLRWTNCSAGQIVLAVFTEKTPRCCPGGHLYLSQFPLAGIGQWCVQDNVNAIFLTSSLGEVFVTVIN